MLFAVFFFFFFFFFFLLISFIISSPGQLMPWPAVRLSLAFQIFDIFRLVSRIELKLSGRYCGNLESQNFYNRSVLISKMAAILKIV